ncbi:YHS domain-containing protein [Candidatus Omnitrophota bacterium]
MRNKVMILFTGLLLIGFVCVVTAFAQCAGQAKAETSKAGEMMAASSVETEAGATDNPETSGGEVVNTVCPVMGKPVSKDTPYTIVYAGKKIGFCCAACLESFKKNPEEYMDKLEKTEE